MEEGPLATLFPALAQAARTVGSPQIRAAGSIGGNLGTCSPAGDALPVLAALDAQVELRSLHTTRMVAFSDFMTGPKRSVLQPNELILGVRMRPLDGFQGYAKVGVRNAMVISVASVCLAVDASARSIRLALGSVGPTIIRCSRAERLVSAELANSASWHMPEDLARRVAETAADESSPIDDHRSTAAYRRHAVAVLTRRLLDRSSREQS
jgi:CO/xanthine dehydrogenase FAD-binding subunit